MNLLYYVFMFEFYFDLPKFIKTEIKSLFIQKQKEYLNFSLNLNSTTKYKILQYNNKVQTLFV